MANTDPLCAAVRSGDVGKVREILNQGKCNVNSSVANGMTPLHYACASGNVDVVSALLLEYKASVSVQDSRGKTPLHYACVNGDVNVVHALLSKYEVDVSVQDNSGMTPLHYACEWGRIGVILTLMSKYNADISIRNRGGITPLHYACEHGSSDVIHSLILEYGADSSVRDDSGMALLHYACRSGNIDVVRVLTSEYKADIYVRDNHGMTPLHLSCRSGNVNVVHTLIYEYKADICARDSRGMTPLHYACSSGSVELVRSLISEYRTAITDCDDCGMTAMQHACEHGHLNVVRSLVFEFNADVNACNAQGNTCLHIATKYGNTDVVLFFLHEVNCDPNFHNKLGQTSLHLACLEGHDRIAQAFLRSKLVSCLQADHSGDTALHLASQKDLLVCVKLLVHAGADPFVKNSQGKTPIDVATFRSEIFLADCMAYYHFSRRRYFRSHKITRMFVLGNPGVGKSSLVESLKKESVFAFLMGSPLPPHTAGIVPSIYISKILGRVLFYDCAGGPEYYSSHAAILKSLASSKKGDNVFVIVVDLREDSLSIETTLYYWHSFIKQQSFDRISLLMVGSHLDRVSRDESQAKIEVFKRFSAAISNEVNRIQHFTLDCSYPGSSQIYQLKRQLSTLVMESQQYTLSFWASVLLGVLEKDFSTVTACPVRVLAQHFKNIGLSLFDEAKSLHPVLFELHEIGAVFLLGDCTMDSDHIILNLSEFTNTVYNALFFKSFPNFLNLPYFYIGILPENTLNKILPSYATVECLVQLQYCQKISRKDVSAAIQEFHPKTESFLFFPALCSLDKSDVVWAESDDSFSIGWLALCTDSPDFFPPRFLHVLLLRLVFQFTLPAPLAGHELSRRCTVWKSGVQWKAENGVDCMVELIKSGKGVVVFSKSLAAKSESCVSLFTQVVHCVMEAKAEFCGSIKPHFYLVDSSADYLNKDHLFSFRDVERALTSPEEVAVVISTNGQRTLARSKLSYMSKFTQWSSLFPMDFQAVLLVLADIVRFDELGMWLGAPRDVLEAIKIDFPHDICTRQRELVKWWMVSSQDPPCWKKLVEALKKINENVKAETIRKEHGLHIQLQEKMMDKATADMKPDKEFLQSFADVVGSRWSSLAVPLALSEDEIETLKAKKDLSHFELAFKMLKIWASKEQSTYRDLLHRLTTVSIFQYFN